MFEVPICKTRDQLNCIKSVIEEGSSCFKNCEGLYISSYEKQEIPQVYLDLIDPSLSAQYEKFKGRFSDYGNIMTSHLQMVRIYFDTPTFDRITKDRAAKFVDMLSAIGGTMGLLTGFSLISGIEILYFALRFLHSSIKNF